MQSWPQALNSLNSITPQYLADAFSWNYNHLSSLWEHFGWINEDVGQQARTQYVFSLSTDASKWMELTVSRIHSYGGYSTVTSGGLRIITLNTDFWCESLADGCIPFAFI